ncbi:MAG: type II secretion system protein GspM [Halofilum sp. (in: g-proteobacteria)]|nr:type II secretion system protein GspM [Halofilum sp. (in: g-proteobacteria)]
MKPNNPLHLLAARIDERNRRERLLLALTVAVVVLVVWNALVRTPLAERRAVAVDTVAQLEREIASFEDSRASIEDRIAGLEDDSGTSPTERVRRRLDALDEVLAERTASLISPDQMVRALRDVVNADAEVSLVRLRNAGASPVITEPEDGEDDESASADDDIPRVYRHDVELVVEGRYLAVLAYLERLEGLEWQFQWEAITVETREYPVTRATVSLSTLSLAEDWIGV